MEKIQKKMDSKDYKSDQNVVDIQDYSIIEKKLKKSRKIQYN